MRIVDRHGQPTGEVTEVKWLGTAFFTGDDDGEEYMRVTDFRFEGWSVRLDMSNVSPVAAYLITGSRRMLGRPRKLAINGHEYNRRRRNR